MKTEAELLEAVARAIWNVGLSGTDQTYDELVNDPDNPLPDLEWPGADKPASWCGRDSLGQITKVYRDYDAYCD